MDEKKKIKFEQYGIEFDTDEFENMKEADMKECYELLNKIEKIIK